MAKPEPVVAAIIKNKQDEILLCQSAKWNNKYVVPGGHIEFGETFEEALRREVLEETGLRIYDIELIGIKETIRKHGSEIPKHYLLFDFMCRTHDVNVILNEEAFSYVWCKMEDVNKYDLDIYTRDFFKALLEEDSHNRRCILFNA